jgi:hypothetical protein
VVVSSSLAAHPARTKEAAIAVAPIATKRERIVDIFVLSKLIRA